MKKGTVITVLFLVLLGYISFSLIYGGKTIQCEICVEYNDMRECQKVEGMDKETAVMMGISTACAAVTNGRTESMECTQTPPVKLQCENL